MNDDKADGSRIAHGAEALDDTGRLQAQPVVRQRFGEHDLAGSAPPSAPGGTVHPAFERGSVGMMRPRR